MNQMGSLEGFLDRPLKERAADEYSRVYLNEVGNLNRAQRRTAHGRQLVAEAHAKALQAKVDFLELIVASEFKGGAA